MVVAVFFGSRSFEHDISILTAQLIIDSLFKLGHEVLPVYISKSGQWLLQPPTNQKVDLTSLKTFTTEDKDWLANGFQKYYLDLENSLGNLVFKQKGVFGKEITAQIAFPAMHGSFGEDGTLQGLLEMLNVPYVGCDVASSSISMNKILTKLFYQSLNVPTSKFVWLQSFQWQKQKQEFLQKVQTELKLPVFVKPPLLGSSIGISKVDSWDKLEEALELAFYYDQQALVEEGVQNLLDLTCCVIGKDEDVSISLVQQSAFSKDMFSYEDKYLSGGGAQTGNDQKSLIIPANISQEATLQIQNYSKALFQNLGCSGIARFDFLMDSSTNQIFASEINPLPGSLYHHLWKASGLEFPDLLSKLLQIAQESWQNKQKINYDFKSDVLKIAASTKMGGKKQ